MSPKHTECVHVILDCQKILSEYLPPDGISKDEAINQLLAILDGHRSRSALGKDSE